MSRLGGRHAGAQVCVAGGDCLRIFAYLRAHRLPSCPQTALFFAREGLLFCSAEPAMVLLVETRERG
ncbi:MAG: hypothetical protein ACLP7W_04890, partial [Solirubrobacteraceae bacterium]